MRCRRNVVFCVTLSVFLVVYFYSFLNDKIEDDLENEHSKQHKEVVWVDTKTSSADFDPAIYLGEIKLSGKSDGYRKHSFNQLKSDGIPWDRDIPDSRDKRCVSKIYPKNLPATSVIIAFHNEARSTLLRTVKSVLSRTPAELLKEIILVDDSSADPNDGNLLLFLPKVKLLRNRKRQGLIRSRIYGADAASASVVTFLDSHCEVNREWLQPLLIQIIESPKVVVSPVIDIIHAETFKYIKSSAQLTGGFDWSMSFKWDFLSARKKQHHLKYPTDSIKTPVIAGGLFTIQKDWFIKLGKYDPELNIWGGENFELSFKTWMCGGSMEIVPCSRVGHVFRQQHPYSFPDGNGFTYVMNVQRVAEVWMDSYKQYLYRSRGGKMPMASKSLEQRKLIRRSLNCKPFKWYLDHIYPELRIPSSNVSALGELRQGVKRDPFCFTNPSKNQLVPKTCHLQGGDQEWEMTNSGLIRSKHSGNCVASSNDQKYIVLLPCDKNDQTQRWKIMIRERIRHVKSGLCIELYQNLFSLKECKEHNLSQRWRFSMQFFY